MGSLLLGPAFLPFSSPTLCLLSAGLRQAMGTFGALMGSLIAGLAYTLSGRNYAVTFSLSALPALGALLLVTTVGHVPSCIKVHARLQSIVRSIAPHCIAAEVCRTAVGHLPNCTQLYARATGCMLICCRSYSFAVGHMPTCVELHAQLCAQLEPIVC